MSCTLQSPACCCYNNILKGKLGDAKLESASSWSTLRLALLMGTQNGILNNSGIAIEDFYIFEFFNTCDFTRSKAKLSETNVPKAETSKFLPSFHSNIVSRAMQWKFWPSTRLSTNQKTVDQLKLKTVMLLVERSVEQACCRRLKSPSNQCTYDGAPESRGKKINGLGLSTSKLLSNATSKWFWPEYGSH